MCDLIYVYWASPILEEFQEILSTQITLPGKSLMTWFTNMKGLRKPIPSDFIR